ncbi:MAG TPA: endonuclease domain-containing protein [Trebonia sp.]|nr:endonuclease domain-containing protein [Trebonia sp.]
MRARLAKGGYTPSDRTAKTCGRCIRGLLCVKCNTALGYIEKRRDAVDAYLARYEASKGLKSA